MQVRQVLYHRVTLPALILTHLINTNLYINTIDAFTLKIKNLKTKNKLFPFLNICAQITRAPTFIKTYL